MIKINDETISAFLDGELSEPDRAAVRDSISRNPALGERLEALARVDSLVKKQARALDGRPMPEGVLRLLGEEGRQEAGERPQGKVVFPGFWRRSRRFAARHSALAASLALVLGFAAGQLSSPWISPRTQDAGMPALAAYAATLDSLPSGEAAALGAGTALLGRFSFQDTQARYCRLYQLQSPTLTSENVACRGDQGWTLVASVQLPGPEEAADYRPASVPRILDALLDPLMQGEPLSLQEEAGFLAR